MNIRRLSALALSAAFTAIAAPAAMAADLIISQPDPIPVTPQRTVPLVVQPTAAWGGMYAGISGAYTFGQLDENFSGTSIDTDGYGGVGFVGYNWQRSRWVFGAEADVGYTADEVTEQDVTIESGLDASLRARLGYALSDRFMIYGTVGGAYGAPTITTADGEVSEDMFGLTYGGGAEMKFGRRMFGRVEYRHVALEATDVAIGNNSYEFEQQNNKVMLGIGMHF